MLSPLEVSVVAAAACSALGLALLRRQASAYGVRVLHAPAAGDPAAGVRYAFTGAMSPGAKESVREHRSSYLAGLAYHAGIFTALGLLVATLCGVPLPAALRWLCRVPLILGTMGGTGLLLKRMLQSELRGLSHPDDFLSNLLATAFVGLALLGGTTWLLSAALLLFYAPLGKIRHCLFFFLARRNLGAFFGRRGVFPPGSSHVH